MHVLRIDGPRAIGACAAIAENGGAFKMPHPTKSEARVIFWDRANARASCDALRHDIDAAIRKYPELAAPEVPPPTFEWSRRGQISSEL